jgi:uncharacterized protein
MNIAKENIIDNTTNAICINESSIKEKWYHYIKYLIVGVLFGIVFIKAEIFSWYRIQEMFRLQEFHMYGVIGTAVLVGLVSIQIIKRYNVKTISGEKVELHDKKFNKGQVYGGLIFGLGWALTGSCPGPMFVQIGAGFTVVLLVLLSAIGGTWLYGFLKDKLPH